MPYLHLHDEVIKNGIIFVLLLLAQNVFAQEANKTLKGTITDRVTGETLPFVKILAYSTDSTFLGYAQSDFDGYYEIKRLPKGRVLLSMEFMGYKKVTRKVRMPRRTQEHELNILMEDHSYGIEEVKVISYQVPEPDDEYGRRHSATRVTRDFYQLESDSGAFAIQFPNRPEKRYLKTGQGKVIQHQYKSPHEVEFFVDWRYRIPEDSDSTTFAAETANMEYYSLADFSTYEVTEENGTYRTKFEATTRDEHLHFILILTPTRFYRIFTAQPNSPESVKVYRLFFDSFELF